jgi:hypothetical protein
VAAAGSGVVAAFAKAHTSTGFQRTVSRDSRSG